MTPAYIAFSEPSHESILRHSGYLSMQVLRISPAKASPHRMPGAPHMLASDAHDLRVWTMRCIVLRKDLHWAFVHTMRCGAVRCGAWQDR